MYFFFSQSWIFENHVVDCHRSRLPSSDSRHHCCGSGYKETQTFWKVRQPSTINQPSCDVMASYRMLIRSRHQIEICLVRWAYTSTLAPCSSRWISIEAHLSLGWTFVRNKGSQRESTVHGWPKFSFYTRAICVLCMTNFIYLVLSSPRPKFTKCWLTELTEHISIFVAQQWIGKEEWSITEIVLYLLIYICKTSRIGREILRVWTLSKRYVKCLCISSIAGFVKCLFIIITDVISNEMSYS